MAWASRRWSHGGSGRQSVGDDKQGGGVDGCRCSHREVRQRRMLGQKVGKGFRWTREEETSVGLCSRCGGAR